MVIEKRTIQNYTEDFKRDTVALVIEQGCKLTEAAHNYAGLGVIRCFQVPVCAGRGIIPTR
ncbi:MAG: hypothetical protein E4H07_01160 [Nitrosomonadales bacterium]|jgi:hypothetical protein|nr:MAG: hypothetical protein E4H07_01160 [Nitrosomonadales bacterium]